MIITKPLASEGLGALAATCKRLRAIAWPLTFRRLCLSLNTFERSSGCLENEFVENARFVLYIFTIYTIHILIKYKMLVTDVELSLSS